MGTNVTPLDPNSLAYMLSVGATSQPNVPAPNVQPATAPDINAQTPAQTAPQQAPPIGQQPAPAQQAPPRMGGTPLLMRYIAQMIHPGMIPGAPGQPDRPVSRGDATLSFLSEFLGNFSQALAASGHGPGSNIRGLAAGIQAPYQRALGQFQVGQQAQAQQAGIESEQAKTGLTQAQTEMMRTSIPIQTPTGQTVYVPASQAGNIFRGLGAAQVGAQAKMSVAQMQLAISTGQVSKVLPAQDAQGNTVMRAFNKFGQPIGDLPGALPSASYMPKSTNTIEYKQLDDGSIVALPKGTTSQPVLPGKGGAAPPKGGSVPVAVKDNQGNPLIGKGATTSTTRTMVETAPKVIDLIDRMKGQMNDLEKSGELGPGMSRWNEFWSGKVGTDNPQFRSFMTNATLLSTLLMRMHMGARGSTEIMKHFDDMIGAGHQSAANMRAALDQMELYANDVKGAAPLPPNYGKSNQPNKVPLPSGAIPGTLGGKHGYVLNGKFYSD